MDTDLDTLATALYVTADDLLKAHPEQVPARPVGGFVEQISDAELIVLAVMQAFLGYTSEARWLRYAHRHLTPMFFVSAAPVGLQQAAAEVERHHGLAGCRVGPACAGRHR